MSPKIRKVQSQEVIDVSQDSFSDPILKNTPPRSAPSTAPLDGETQNEDRIEESITYDYLNGNKLPEEGPTYSQPPTDARARDSGGGIGESQQDQPHQESAEIPRPVVVSRGPSRILGDTQVIAAHLYSSATAGIDSNVAVPHAEKQDEVEEDLYGTTPPRKSQVDLQKLGQRSDLIAVPLFNVAGRSPVASASEVDVLESPSTRRQIEPQPTPNHLKPDIHPASATPSPAKSTAPPSINMAPGSKATQSTGRLPAAKGALTALQGRRQQILGHSGEASTKLFDRAASGNARSTRSAGNRAHQQDSPAKSFPEAHKSKDKMKAASGSSKAAMDKPQTRGLSQEPTQSRTAGSKRKADADTTTTTTEDIITAGHADKRARVTARDRDDKSAKSVKSVTSASAIVQPDDIFDLPESPAKAGPSQATKQPTRKVAPKVAKSTVKTNARVSKKASAAVKRPRKAASDENPGNGRNLRSRKIQQSSVESAEPEEDSLDAEDMAGDPDEAKLDAEISFANKTLQPHKDLMHDNQQTEKRDHDAHAAGVAAKIERPLAAPSIETTAASPDDANPSGSQFNAIVLSDHSELSSYIDQVSPPPEILHEASKSKRPAVRLQTPAAIQSTPPKASSRAGSQSLRGTGRVRKTQIISFDKRGALNQGSIPVSWNPHASVPPLTVAVNWGSSTANVKHAAQKKASSIATSVRSGRFNVAAPPSNIARDVHDALAGLSKDRPQAHPTADSNAKSVRTSVPARVGDEKASPPKHDEMNYESDDSGFTTLNDMENFVNSPSPGRQLNAELEYVPTASQVIMPPPELKKRSPPKAIEIAAPAVSNQNSTTGASTGKTERKRQILTDVPPESVAKHATVTVSKEQSTAAHPKHSAMAFLGPVQHRNDPSSTTATAALETASYVAKPPAKQNKLLRNTATKPSNIFDASSSRQQSDMRMMAAMSISKGPPHEPQPKSEPNRPANESGRAEVTSPGMAAQPGRPHDLRRKRVRYVSQNSQTVDVNGSPVPLDMEVPERSTVLETFSQQAEGSSGADQQAPLRFKTPIDTINAAEDDAFSVPPSYQPPILSSNTKARPGPAGSSSKTIRHLKVTKVESDAFMTNRMQPTALSDPFTLSKAPQGPGLSAKHGDHLLERMRNFAQEVGRPTAVARSLSRDRVMSPEKIPTAVNNITKRGEPMVAPEFAVKFASDLVKQVAALREHTQYARAAEEDPDKTLVDDCSQETELSVETSSESSEVSSRDATPELMDEPESSSQASDRDQDEFHMWRKGLKPHQLDLYEELVKIARVVTGYVTKQEASADAMIDENYRRELIMVEQEEEVRKKQYKQYIINLQQKKREKVEELLSLEGVLQGVLDASAVCWEEHCIGRAERERGIRKVDDLISSWS